MSKPIASIEKQRQAVNPASARPEQEDTCAGAPAANTLPRVRLAYE